MSATPPVPLFRGERVIASWPAHYIGLYPVDRGSLVTPGASLLAAHADAQRPSVLLPPAGRPSRSAALRNRVVAREDWAVKGHLHLTDWRLVFATEAHWSHRLEGSLSLFLVRTQRVSPLFRRRWDGSLDRRLLCLSHQGDPDRAGPVQCFVVDDSAQVAMAMSGQLHRIAWREVADREAFEQNVVESWWRAGLGLLSGPTRASMPGPFATSPGHESYRERGVEPPDFAQLRRRLRGVEGEGLAQLPWLFAPPSELLPPPSEPARHPG